MAISSRLEVIHVINTGAQPHHSVCISILGCHGGFVKVFDSFYRNPNSVVINYASRMLLQPQTAVTFVKEKMEKQVGINDCGCFALTSAADLCHG